MSRLPLTSWVRPYRPLLALAFVAMAVESAATVWEPWPLKLIVDNVLGGKPLPPWLANWAFLGTAPLDVLNAAVVALLAITALGAVGAALLVPASASARHSA